MNKSFTGKFDIRFVHINIYVTCVCGSEGNLFEDEIIERRND